MESTATIARARGREQQLNPGGSRRRRPMSQLTQQASRSLRHRPVGEILGGINELECRHADDARRLAHAAQDALSDMSLEARRTGECRSIAPVRVAGLGEPLAQERHDVVRVRIPPEHRFREHGLAVHVHVEDAALAGNDLEQVDHALPLLENPRRQTGGVRSSASGNAVLDADVMARRHTPDSITRSRGRALRDENGAVDRGRELAVGGDERELEHLGQDCVKGVVRGKTRRLGELERRTCMAEAQMTIEWRSLNLTYEAPRIIDFEMPTPCQAQQRVCRLGPYQIRSVRSDRTYPDATNDLLCLTPLAQQPTQQGGRIDHDLSDCHGLRE